MANLKSQINTFRILLLQLYGLNIDEVPAEYFQNYLIDLFFEYSAMNRTLYFSDNFVKLESTIFPNARLMKGANYINFDNVILKMFQDGAFHIDRTFHCKNSKEFIIEYFLPRLQKFQLKDCIEEKEIPIRGLSDDRHYQTDLSLVNQELIKWGIYGKIFTNELMLNYCAGFAHYKKDNLEFTINKELSYCLFKVYEFSDIKE